MAQLSEPVRALAGSAALVATWSKRSLVSRLARVVGRAGSTLPVWPGGGALARGTLRVVVAKVTLEAA